MWNRHFGVIRGKTKKTLFDETMTREFAELLKDTAT